MSGQKFPAAEKVYGALLRAYPAEHRAAYGEAMAQLFRDQCRDAWDGSKNLGLLKLWLRVLPDLATTSIMERLAALNERKSMKDKLANLGVLGATPGGVFIRVFVPVFLLVAIISTAITFILPESFASTARIKIEGNEIVPGKTDFDPYFLQTQFEIIHSRAVLDPVIEKLQLNRSWGKKYFAGQELKPAESLEMLKGRLSVATVSGTKLASITVYSGDRNEAAQIANAIAESYRDYRQKNSGWKGGLPQPSSVQITDAAEPGRFPVKPNKTLNIVLGFVGGIFLASAVGGVAALIVLAKRKQRQNAGTPA